MTKEERIKIIREVIKYVDIWEREYYKGKEKSNIFKYILEEHYFNSATHNKDENDNNPSILEQIQEKLKSTEIIQIPHISKLEAIIKWLSDELEEQKYEIMIEFWKTSDKQDLAFINITNSKDIESFRAMFSLPHKNIKKACIYEDGCFEYEYLEEGTSENESKLKIANNISLFGQNPFFEVNWKPGKHYYFPSSPEKGGYNLDRFKVFWETFFPEHFKN
ncbi:MAG: hypothetical protein ACOCV8_00585 [Spirochaetota bacterium]